MRIWSLEFICLDYIFIRVGVSVYLKGADFCVYIYWYSLKYEWTKEKEFEIVFSTEFEDKSHKFYTFALGLHCKE